LQAYKNKQRIGIALIIGTLIKIFSPIKKPRHPAGFFVTCHPWRSPGPEKRAGPMQASSKTFPESFLVLRSLGYKQA